MTIIEAGVRVRVPCNLCGADDPQLVMETTPQTGDDAGTKMFASTCDYLGRESLVRCRRCGLMYFNPQLRPGDILSGYASVDDRAYVDQSEGRLRTFAACWSKMKPLLPSSGRILDVGAAAGFFLKAAQDGGWQAHGVEPNAGLRDYARKQLGVRMDAATLEEAGYPDDHFDAVTLWDVLEHVTDPSAVLREVRRVLKPGGLIVVNYPDISDPLARLCGRRWWFLLSAHLYYFTPKTVTAILEKSGFEVLHIRPHFQMLPLGYLIERLKMFSPLVSRIAGTVVRWLGLSRTVVRYYASQRCVYARKKVGS